MGATDAAELLHLDAFLGDGRAAGFPATVYVGLFTATPNDTGGGTEVAGGSYARVAVANTTANWPNATGSGKRNGTVITFPTATANWGTVTHWGIFTAASAGTLLHYNALTASVAVNSGMTPSFPVNGLTLTAD